MSDLNMDAVAMLFMRIHRLMEKSMEKSHALLQWASVF